MLSEEIAGLLALLSIAWWPVTLTIMFLLRKRFPPSNDRYAACRALAYVFIFWVSRTMGTWVSRQVPMGAGAGTADFLTLMFTLPIAILWIYFAYHRIEGASWKELGWNFSHIKREIVSGVLLGVLLFILVNIYWSGNLGFPQPKIYVNVEAAAMLFIASFAIASWQEENIYRGYLQPKLAVLTGEWKANAIQAVLFSIAHIGYWQFTSLAPFITDLAILVIMGFILGWYRQRYDSIVAPFIAHGLVDFLPIFWQ
jgi:membrane protease YdiL (CAAX protease family)